MPISLNQFQIENAKPDHWPIYIAQNGAHIAKRTTMAEIQAEFDINWHVNPPELTMTFGQSTYHHHLYPRPRTTICQWCHCTGTKAAKESTCRNCGF